MSKILFCFPCAGGNANNFDRIAEKLNCTVYQIEYSGHWTRYEERLYASLEECVKCLYQEIANLIKKSDEIFLLGHSMGAIVAYEIAVLLQIYDFNVKTLFLVASLPPNEIDYKNLEFKNDYEIKDFLAKIRQTPHGVLDSAFFEDNLLPAVRNDFYMLYNYAKVMKKSRKVNIDIVCFYGTKDPLVSKMDGWKLYTEKNSLFIECSGNHFSFFDLINEPKILEVITNMMNI